MSGWSPAATSRPSRSLSSSQDQTITQTRRRRRWPSSKRPEPPPFSPTNEAPPSYTTSRDLTHRQITWASAACATSSAATVLLVRAEVTCGRDHGARRAGSFRRVGVSTRSPSTTPRLPTARTSAHPHGHAWDDLGSRRATTSALSQLRLEASVSPPSVDALGVIVRRYRAAALNALAAPTMSSSTIAAAGRARLTMPALWPA
jgi:hypothetical protein